MPNKRTPKGRTTLQFKLARTMLLMLGILAAILTGLLVSVSVRMSQKNLGAIESHHREALATKAKLLAENHAIALKGLVLDNAFGDVDRLIQRTVDGENDVLYGLFTSSDGKVWAFAGPRATAGVPNQKAYAAIGLPEGTLAVRQETIRETVVAGESVVEIAIPVRDGSEDLGTLRYGLSTRRMHEALQSARAESRRDIEHSLVLSVGVALLAALIAALMSRRAAHRIAEPITELAGAARNLAAGNRLVRVEIGSNDEVEELGSAFNQMVSDLKTSYDSLEDLNRTLEQKVEERTVELGRRNGDMRLVLDNVEEGLLTLTPEAIMKLEHSSIVDRWFGPFGEDTTFFAYLSRTSPAFADFFELAWEALREGLLPLEVCVAQLPRVIEARGSTWHLRYTPLMNGERLEGMLVVILDVTTEIARQKEEQAQREILTAFQRLMRDRDGFMAFHAEMSGLLEAVCSGKYDRDIIAFKRTIHTLKGNAALFGLERFASLCHDIEDQMAETRDLPTQSSMQRIQQAWRQLTDNIMLATSEPLGVPAVIVAGDEVQTLASSLRAIPSATHLARQVEAWKLEPIQIPLRRLAEQAHGLAKKLGKGEIDVNVQAQMIRCDPKRWGPFWSDAAHVVRNAVDHGLEAPEERAGTGKKRGLVKFAAAWDGSELVVSISDNGKGIPFEAVRKRAASLGLPHATQEDLVEALFADGVSTADHVTDVSGRGVGMAAVRSRVEAMGGRVLVRSAAGTGTTWTFRFARPNADRPGSSLAPPP
jgi:two-component system chemotaxis sensor kinase CheA